MIPWSRSLSLRLETVFAPRVWFASVNRHELRHLWCWRDVSAVGDNGSSIEHIFSNPSLRIRHRRIAPYIDHEKTRCRDRDGLRRLTTKFVWRRPQRSTLVADANRELELELGIAASRLRCFRICYISCEQPA